GVGTIGADLHLVNRALAVAANPLDGDADRSEILRQAEIVDLEIDKLTQPMGREFHCWVRPNLSKLFQEPYISVEEQLNVIHAVLQNRDAVRSHAKGEAAHLLGVVVHKTIHTGIDHAAAQNFDPAGLLAGAARFGATLSAASTDET